MKVGVLALQGCVGPHEEILKRLGVRSIRVRAASDLEGLHGLILPGGESTTMLRLMKLSNLMEPLRDFSRHRPTWGICAGAVLLAERVVHPSQESLGSLSIEAHRNYYGCQLDSFSARLEFPTLGRAAHVDFIRAPRLLAMNDDVEILATYRGEQVLLRRRNVLAASFHIELTEATWLHEYFLHELND